MTATDTIFYIVILIISVVIHEVCHGFAAEALGDDTARHAGRLTLNPIAHLDLFGSIVLPALLVISGSPFLFGWAKPVPYNPDNLRNKKWGTIAVAGAGVLANLFIATIFGLLIRFTINSNFSVHFYAITSIIVLVNLGLAIFNLVPIPPLDGSKILFSFAPYSWKGVINFLERYGFFVLLVFIVLFSDYLYPILAFLFHLLSGLAL